MRRVLCLLPFLAACDASADPVYLVTWDNAPVFVGREVFSALVILAILAIGSYAERRKP
jgi:hypothetical protein